MRQWTEPYASIMTRNVDDDAVKTIHITNYGRLSPKEMVIVAIKLAKQYNCIITKPVTFTPEMVGGRVTFSVECHRLTYHFMYRYGLTTHLRSTEVKDSDIAKYKEKFGTTKCIHQGFKKKYWYTDNWYGERKEFKTLKAAKEAAKQETGNSVTIYTNFPYGRGSEIVCFAKASGFTPP